MPRDIRPGVARLFRLALRRRRDVVHEAGDEVAFHLEEREQQLMERGLSATEARAQARRTFGDIDAARNPLVTASRRRENRSVLSETAANLAQDVRFAVRSLRRAPSFLIIALACLTLGIGALASAGLLRGLLYGVSVFDCTVLSGVVLLLAVVSVAAALAPALRASRVDPLSAIRAE